MLLGASPYIIFGVYTQAAYDEGAAAIPFSASKASPLNASWAYIATAL